MGGEVARRDRFEAPLDFWLDFWLLTFRSNRLSVTTAGRGHDVASVVSRTGEEAQCALAC